MLKNILIISLLVSGVYAQQKSNKFKIDELAILPHPGKFIKTGKVDITQEQMERMKNEVKKVSVAKYQEKMREAFKVEKKLQRAVKKGKTKEDLKEIINQISQLKIEALEHRIEALNKLKEILTKEQWQKVNKLTYN